VPELGIGGGLKPRGKQRSWAAALTEAVLQLLGNETQNLQTFTGGEQGGGSRTASRAPKRETAREVVSGSD